MFYIIKDIFFFLLLYRRVSAFVILSILDLHGFIYQKGFDTNDTKYYKCKKFMENVEN